MTRVGSQVEQRFVFLWDSKPERLTLGLLIPINREKLFRAVDEDGNGLISRFC